MPPTTPKTTKSPPGSPKSQNIQLSSETFKIKSETQLQKRQKSDDSFKSSLAELGIKLPSNAPPIVVNAMKQQQQQQEMKEKAIKEEVAANDDFKKFSTLYERIVTTLSTNTPSSTVTQTVEELKGYFSDLDPKFKYDAMVFRKEGSKIPHSQCIKDTIKRIRDMISGLSAFNEINLQPITVFQYDYPDLLEEKTKAGNFENEDIPRPVDMVIMGAADATHAAAATAAAAEVEVEEIITKKNVDRKVIDSYKDNKLSFRQRCPTFTSTLMSRLCRDPTSNGKFLRMSPSKLQDIMQKWVIAGNINIPLLQLTLYKEFMDAIKHYRGIPKNLSRYRLIEVLFVKLQRNIRDFCATASQWSPGLCPGDYATYMHSPHHYFNFFRMIYDVAKLLQTTGFVEKTQQIIMFLCRSVFILLTDEEVKRVVQFISELLQRDNNISAQQDETNRNSRIKIHVRFIEELLTKGLLTTIGGDSIKGIFFRRLICYSPIYVWVQTLFLGEVVLSKEQIDEEDTSSQTSYESDNYSSPELLSQKCSQPGGGRTKKRGHTNKSKKNINKKSGHNKKVRGNKKSRRNQKRS